MYNDEQLLQLARKDAIKFAHKRLKQRKRGVPRDPPISLEDRFWSRVIKGAENQCWKWLGGVTTGGYGRLFYSGQNIQAHRVSYLLNIGSIPANTRVLHTCNRKRCVNPAHLVLGETFVELTEEQVIEIRARYEAGGITPLELADTYCVCRTTISRVLNYQTHKHQGTKGRELKG